MKSLRILHVAAFCGEAWGYGGIARVVGTLTRELAGRGHHIRLLATDARDSNRRLAPLGPSRRNGVELHVFPNLSNRLAYHAQLFLPLGLGRYVAREARGFDVAHLHGCHHLPGALTATALRRAGVPYVLTPHGTAGLIERRRMAKYLFGLLFERGLVSRSARVLVATQSEARQLARLTHGRVPLALVPNPLPPIEEATRLDEKAAAFRARWQLRGPIISYLGKLTPRKGVDVLIQAMAHLGSPAHLLIAGNDMGEGSRLRRLVTRLGLGKRVTFTGLLTGESRFEALRVADVVACPSRDESFGLVPLEALQVGRPVVVCDDAGCGEVIASLNGGELVPYGDAPRLAMALDRILSEPALWRERARSAQVGIAERFSPAAVCTQLEAEYAAVLNGS